MVTKIDSRMSMGKRVYYLTDSKRGGDLGGYFKTLGEAKRAQSRNRERKPLFDKKYTKRKGRYYLK
jgi:hypothetical protein